MANDKLYRLAEDAGEVLRTLVRKELEVETEDGGWFLVRMLPYRTSENVIEGLVITFVDITATKAAETGRLTFLQNIFDTFQEPAFVLDGKLRVVKANESFCRTFHTNPKKTEGQLVYKIGGGKWNTPKLRELLDNVIPKKAVFANFDVTVNVPGAGERVFRLNGRRIEQEVGLPGMILLSMQDVTGEVIDR